MFETIEKFINWKMDRIKGLQGDIENINIKFALKESEINDYRSNLEVYINKKNDCLVYVKNKGENEIIIRKNVKHLDDNEMRFEASKITDLLLNNMQKDHKDLCDKRSKELSNKEFELETIKNTNFNGNL